MRYFIDSLTSWAYWRYVAFSLNGMQSILAIFGAVYLFIESLDFFGIYARDQYASYAFFIVFGMAVLLSIVFRRPITSTVVTFPKRDFAVEVRIGDLFDATGAVMISTNTIFESDVAGGKIAPDSLQGQFTAKYFTGNQNDLIEQLQSELRDIDGGSPYPIGTTIPVNTHGKTFYFVAMSELNDKGNAKTNQRNVLKALDGLWQHVSEAGELQELAVPLIGTGRGRITTPREKMIELIAESFVKRSIESKVSDLLIIVVRPEDAKRFEINLYEIKDHLRRSIYS